MSALVRRHPAESERTLEPLLTPVMCLHRGLLVIVGAEAEFHMETAQLGRRGHAVGRLSVDVAIDPTVDQISRYSSIQRLTGPFVSTSPLRTPIPVDQRLPT